MADTAIAVTAGTGTNIDARTESTNGDLRQVIVIGDPSANSGVAPVNGTAGLKVDLGSDNDVVATNAGTFAVQVDGAALTALQIMDDWDESDRAKVNIIAGQAGVTAGAGVVSTNTPRITLASDDPAVTALQLIDDWDESDRAKVNLVVGQAGITADAGAVALNTPRITLASDDPAVVALQIMDDWDETDRCAVNLIPSQAGITAGAGIVATNTPRITLASNDPAVTALQVIDDWDESDRAKVNPVAGQVGLAAGTGVDAANALRVSLATDVALPAGTNAIGKLSANTGVDIGDVDVTSIVPGTGATNLGSAEDGAHTTGDVGVAALAVRRDAKAVGAGTDGDYATINVTANGDVRVDGGQAHVVSVSPTVTAGAYATDDTLGGEMEITAAGRVSGGSGLLTGISMAAEDNDADGWAADDVEVLIFDSNPGGTYTDNGALAVTDADAAILLGSVVLDTKVDCGDVTFLYARNVNIPYVCSGSDDLFAVAVNRGGSTPEATDALTFKFHLIRD